VSSGIKATSSLWFTTNDASSAKSRETYWGGFQYYSQASRDHITRNKHQVAIVPAWFLVLVFAVAPARWVFLYRRDQLRRRKGLCRKCGYDLRATPDADGPLMQRCPECGHAVDSASQVNAQPAH
jgi:hypothetical protein